MESPETSEKPEIEKNPAIVSCATVTDEDDHTTLHFSTFDSDGALLNRFSKPSLFDYKPSVFSACRDLLLLIDNTTFLCNIATQELITLPNITDDDDEYYRGTGFGYVPSTKEFKVLADNFFQGNGFKVLTLGADRWRDVEGPPFKVKGYGCFVNGAIHLRSERGDRIATFNLEREEWGSISGPPVQQSFLTSMKELSGFLCVMNRRLMLHGRSSINIWLLKDYDNNAWVECDVPFFALNHDDPYMVEPLAIEDDGRMLVQVDTYSLQLYDLKTKSSREIYNFKEELKELEELNSLRNSGIKVFSSLGHW